MNFYRIIKLIADLQVTFPPSRMLAWGRVWGNTPANLTEIFGVRLSCSHFDAAALQRTPEGVNRLVPPISIPLWWPADAAADLTGDHWDSPGRGQGLCGPGAGPGAAPSLCPCGDQRSFSRCAGMCSFKAPLCADSSGDLEAAWERRKPRTLAARCREGLGMTH